MALMKRRIQKIKGGIMKIFLISLLVLSFSIAQNTLEQPEYVGLMPAVEVTALHPDYEAEAQVGIMPGIEVTAPRYDDEIPAYVGSLPEVTVTASRYEYEDEAWSGLMPEILVTARKPQGANIAYIDKNEPIP
jgi:hypothetical protein